MPGHTRAVGMARIGFRQGFTIHIYDLLTNRNLITGESDHTMEKPFSILVRIAVDDDIPLLGLRRLIGHLVDNHMVTRQQRRFH